MDRLHHPSGQIGRDGTPVPEFFNVERAKTMLRCTIRRILEIQKRLYQPRELSGLVVKTGVF